jgi:hypothetical protein
LGKSAQVVRLKTEKTPPDALAQSPLYGVAMLKIAMELKRQDTAALDDILQGVLRKMNLPEAEFRSFLEANGGLLRAIAQRRRY